MAALTDNDKALVRAEFIAKAKDERNIERAKSDIERALGKGQVFSEKIGERLVEIGRGDDGSLQVAVSEGNRVVSHAGPDAKMDMADAVAILAVSRAFASFEPPAEVAAHKQEGRDLGDLSTLTRGFPHSSPMGHGYARA